MMLNVLREGAKSGVAKFILFGLMTMAVFGLVLMDVGGFFRGGIRQDSVAKIGRDQISSMSFNNTVRTVLSRQGLDPQTAYRLGFINQILQSEISGRLLYKAAIEDGLLLGNKVVAGEINRLLEPFVTPEMNRKEALQRVLMNQGMSEVQFVNALRMEMTNGLLRDTLRGSAAYTPAQEVRDIYRYQHEKRNVKALVLPNSRIKDFQEPSDELLLPFYQAGQERYAIPETRNFSIAVLSQDDLKKTLTISEEDLKAAYEDEIDLHTLPEQRVLEQAILPDQAQAAAVAEKVKASTGLKDAVKAVTSGTDAFLGKETFQKAGLAKEIAEPAFGAEKGAVIGPVETPLGWHVLVLQDVIAPKVKPFEDVREELRKDMLQNKLADQLFAISGQIDDELAGGAVLDEVAENYSLTVRKFGPVRADGSTPDEREGLKGFDDDREKILKTIFDLSEGESAPVLELADGSFAAIQIDLVSPKSYKPFEQIREDLKKVWISDQQHVLNKMKAQQILKALASDEKTLDQLAAESGIPVQNFSLNRAGDTPAPLTAGAQEKFFEIKKGDYAMAALDEGFFVGQVTAISLPETKKITDKELEPVLKAATQGSQDETFLSYLGYLQDKYRVTINQNLLQQMYGPGTEAR